MFASPKKDQLLLTDPADFAYVLCYLVPHTNITVCSCLRGGVPENLDAMYQELLASMSVVGFSETDQDMLFTTLASCAHISNIEFGAAAENVATIENMEPVNKVAQLLKVDAAALADVLLGVNTVTRGEKIRRVYKQNQAYDVRDALAKVTTCRRLAQV